MRIEALSGWTSEQRHVVAACFLGWTLDAFDFFLLVFVLQDIAQEFNTQITEVTFAILLTSAMSGFAPSLTVLLVLRAIFGVAMGGEWPLTMESIPPHARGFVSACCNRAIRPHTSWRRSSTACCSSTSDGAACSWLGSFRRFSFSNPPQCAGIA